MKSTVLALFLGATYAIRINDGDPYFNEPTWNEQHPSAAGFVQFSSCIQAKMAGVECVPNTQYFATGMNGDEDLGEDIIMKGDPFHYHAKEQTHVQLNDGPAFYNAATFNAQMPPAAGFTQTGFATGVTDAEILAQGKPGWNPIVVDTPYEKLPACTGTNGGEAVNCKQEVCSGTNGPKDGPVGTPCSRPEPAAYSDDKAHTTGNLTPTAASFVQAAPEGNPLFREQVLELETPKAVAHTTFYAQRK